MSTRLQLGFGGFGPHSDHIDNVITVRMISWMAGPSPLWQWRRHQVCHDKKYLHSGGDGTFGAFYGLSCSGGLRQRCGSTLQGSEGTSNILPMPCSIPSIQRSLGLEAVSAAALQANAYMERYGVTEADFAKVSVKNHSNAKNNPFAQLPLD